MMLLLPTLTIVLFTAAASASTGLKTYCLTAKDPECDDEWQPFANMASALAGYDLPRGNPFATTAIDDPGLRKQVFNVTFEDEDTREYRMCDGEFRSSGATNMVGYEKVLLQQGNVLTKKVA
jgi:hypothetical protein